jgi:hypothetical protein
VTDIDDSDALVDELTKRAPPDEDAKVLTHSQFKNECCPTTPNKNKRDIVQLFANATSELIGSANSSHVSVEECHFRQGTEQLM